MSNKLKGIFGIITSVWVWLPLSDLVMAYGTGDWWGVPSLITLFIAYVASLVWSFEKLYS